MGRITTIFAMSTSRRSRLCFYAAARWAVPPRTAIRAPEPPPGAAGATAIGSISVTRLPRASGPDHPTATSDAHRARRPRSCDRSSPSTSSKPCSAQSTTPTASCASTGCRAWRTAAAVRAPFLPMLVQWVEHDRVPAEIVARKVSRNGETVLSRPLCPYPASARYRGNGNVGTRRVLRVGKVRLVDLLAKRSVRLPNRLDAQVSADFSCEGIADFRMPRDGRPFAQRCVLPPGVPRTLTNELAALTRQVLDELASLHTEIFSSR
jgi:hypothetical protein